MQQIEVNNGLGDVAAVQGQPQSESMLQVLLTTTALEGPLTRVLLEALVAMCVDEDMHDAHELHNHNSEDQEDTQSGPEGNSEGLNNNAADVENNSNSTVPLQRVIISQLRVLDNGNCSDEVTELLLEAFAGLPACMQAHMAAVVGEMVPQTRSAGASFFPSRG